MQKKVSCKHKKGYPLYLPAGKTACTSGLLPVRDDITGELPPFFYEEPIPAYFCKLLNVCWCIYHLSEEQLRWTTLALWKEMLLRWCSQGLSVFRPLKIPKKGAILIW